MSTETKSPESNAVESMGWLACPACGTPNGDDWPIEVAGKIVQGGCQECWEKECDASWWKAVIALDQMQANVCDEGRKKASRSVVLSTDFRPPFLVPSIALFGR